MQARFGYRVHKVAIDADFTCPNRDGSKGRGGCTFCNNVSFSPNGRQPSSIAQQITAGKAVINRRTGAKKFIAYFQAYTNTYADVSRLAQLYDQALAEADIIGLSIGTRPDCLPEAVIALLADYQRKGYEIWLELGLQSAHDKTLERVNRGHGFSEYEQAVRLARKYGLQICTHLILGLPGETSEHCFSTLQRVLDLGVDGLKFHPLHVVKGTQLANQWRRGEYQPLELDEYITLAADLIEMTPAEVVFHRLTATASTDILLAPTWCSQKWRVLNLIAEEMNRRHHTGQSITCPPSLTTKSMTTELHYQG